MRNARQTGVKQLRPLIAAAAELPVLWRMHQADNTARNFAGSNPVAPGYPTVVTLGSTPTLMAGSFATVSGVVGMTELNGTWRCLWISGNAVALDVDSSIFAAYASGGTVTPTILQDEFGVVPALPIQGTVTGVYSNPVFGLTAHGSGSNSLRVTEGLSAFDLSAHTGMLLLSIDAWKSGNPSAKEHILSVGRILPSGANTACGAVTLALATDGQIEFIVRPAAATDAAASNTAIYSGALTNSVRSKVALLLDCTDPAAPEAHVIRDGVLVRSSAITMTAAISLPTVAAGMCIGAQIGSSFVLSGLLGAGGSGARIENLLWWKTTKSFTTVLRAAQDWHRTGQLSPLMV